MAEKTSKYIVRPKIVGDLAHHQMAGVKQQLGPPYIYMEDSMVPEADLLVHVAEIKEVPPNFKPYVDPISTKSVPFMESWGNSPLRSC